MSNGVVLSGLLATPRAAQRLLLGLILVLTLGVLWYVHAATLDTISRDEWHLVEMLRHWYAGSFSLHEIWSTNTASQHRVPAFKLYFLADALWFGLDVRIGCYIGVLALGVFTWAMYRYFLRTRPEGMPTAFDHYAFVPVALTMFSMVQSHIYTYDLLAEFAITGTALFGILWMQMDLQLRRPQPAWRHLAFAAALALLLTCFSAGKGPSLVLATLVITAFLASAHRGRSSLKVYAWIVAAIVVGELVYWWGGAGDTGGSGLSGLVRQALHEPAGVLQYVLRALGAAAITADGLSIYAPEQRPTVLLIYGVVILAVAVVALLLYLRLRSYRRAVVPLALAVFVAGYVGELVVGRFGAGIDNGSAPRYVYTDHLLVVAVLFVFADAARVVYANGRRQWAVLSLVALTACVGAIELHNARIAYDSITSEVRVQQGAVQIARQRFKGGAATYPAWYCPAERLCDEGTRFLAEHRLSFMRAPDPTE